MVGRGDGGGGASAFDGAGGADGFGAEPEDGAEGEESPAGVGDEGAIDAGEGFHDAHFEILDAASACDVVEGAFGNAGREVVWIAGVVHGLFAEDLITASDEEVERGVRIAQDDEECAMAVLAEIERGLEQAMSEVRRFGFTESLDPGLVFGGNIEEAPACVAVGVGHFTAGKDLDFLSGCEEEQDMISVEGGACVRGVGAGAQATRAARPGLDGIGPVGHIDDTDEIAMPVNKENGPDAVAQAMEAFDGGEADVVAGGTGRVGAIGLGRIVGSAEEQHARGEVAIFVSGESGGAEGFEGGGDADGVGRGELFGDDQVLNLIGEHFIPEHGIGIKEREVAAVEEAHGRFDEESFGGEKRRWAGGEEGVDVVEPIDQDAEAIRIIA